MGPGIASRTALARVKASQRSRGTGDGPFVKLSASPAKPVVSSGCVNARSGRAPGMRPGYRNHANTAFQHPPCVRQAPVIAGPVDRPQVDATREDDLHVIVEAACARR